MEFRIDLLKSPNFERIRRDLSGFSKRSIFTVRSQVEGGGFKGEEPERLELLRRLGELSPAYVDVELRALEGNRNASPGDFGSDIVVSWHNLSRTPRRAGLRSIMARAFSYGDLVKIVATANSATDNLAILSLYDVPGPPPIAFCMGAPGIFSRIMAMERGSPIVYASLPGEPIAPGQISVAHLLALRRRLKDD